MQGMLRLQKRFHGLAAEAPLPNMRFVHVNCNSTWLQFMSGRSNILLSLCLQRHQGFSIRPRRHDPSMQLMFGEACERR